MFSFFFLSYIDVVTRVLPELQKPFFPARQAFPLRKILDCITARCFGWPKKFTELLRAFLKNSLYVFRFLSPIKLFLAASLRALCDSQISRIAVISVSQFSGVRHA